MKKNFISRALTLTKILLKEQFKEPISLFWVIISPCAIFYFLALSKNDTTYFSQEYIYTLSWFYSYIASSIAFFGFSFYIIGRRESGFIRSFIYNKTSKAIFLLAQFSACSVISIIYCSVFYLVTRPPFGDYNVIEFLTLLFRFYLCYMVFCIPGLLFTLPSINFQNAHTLISIASFVMLTLGIAGTA